MKPLNALLIVILGMVLLTCLLLPPLHGQEPPAEEAPAPQYERRIPPVPPLAPEQQAVFDSLGIEGQIDLLLRTLIELRQDVGRLRAGVIDWALGPVVEVVPEPPAEEGQ